MGEVLQTVVTGLLVLLAAAYLGRKYTKSRKSGGGCSNCGLAQTARGRKSASAQPD